jgi:serine/threonine-protein kinase HipA
LYTDAGPRIAPIYDVVCTEVYPCLPKELPLWIGNAPTVESLSRHAIKKFARSVSLGEKAVLRIAGEVADALDERAATVLSDTARLVGAAETLEAMARLTARRVRLIRTLPVSP